MVALALNGPGFRLMHEPAGFQQSLRKSSCVKPTHEAPSPPTVKLLRFVVWGQLCTVVLCNQRRDARDCIVQCFRFAAMVPRENEQHNGLILNEEDARIIS